MKKNIQKCLIIAGLSVIFWLISLCIMGIVNDRVILSKDTQNEISETWGGSQDLIGPIICVPVYSDTTTSDMPYTCMYVLPDELKITSSIESETLHRGLFDASVYRAKITGKGTYDLAGMQKEVLSADGNQPTLFDWSNAQIITAIKDKRGIEEGFKMKIEKKNFTLDRHFMDYGNSNLYHIFYNKYETICKKVDLSDEVGKDTVSFEFMADLKGSGDLNLYPIGKISTISMSGNCYDPSFYGIMLPSTREVTKNGFNATWKISNLNRNDVDQVFYSVHKSYPFQYIGTKLLVQGGQYTQTDRALKYAFLVILLSLSAVFVSELCVKSEINLLCYLLIGSGLVLFYLMLLSFGELVGFSIAYFLSALLILGMITFYLKAILKNNNVALVVCSFLFLIDIFIYVLLSIASMALLVGTLGLFIILGLAMFFSIRLVNKTNEIEK